MIKNAPGFLLAIALSVPATAAPAANLSVLRSFDIAGPSGLAYDAEHCAIWVANESKTVTLITPWGFELRSFVAELPRVDAIAIQGDHLVLSDGNGTYQRVSREGQSLGDPYRLAGYLSDTDGLFFDNETSDYWVVDDSVAELVRIAVDGTITQRLEGALLPTQLMEPQGVTRDPISGNILVVDDADASDSLFEFSPEGELLSVISLSEGGFDAEGITIQPDTMTVFVAYDDGDRITAFQYMPTPNGHAMRVAEPGGCIISALPEVISKG